MYIPELIFGELLTGSNFNDEEKKITGGRNGFGAKLTNIYSKEFNVECADQEWKKLLKVKWVNNMSNKTTHLSDYKGHSYVMIRFVPDY